MSPLLLMDNSGQTLFFEGFFILPVDRGGQAWTHACCKRVSVLGAGESPV